MWIRLAGLEERFDFNAFLIPLKPDLMMRKEISLAQYGIDTGRIREPNLNIDPVLRAYNLDLYFVVVETATGCAPMPK